MAAGGRTDHGREREEAAIGPAQGRGHQAQGAGRWRDSRAAHRELLRAAGGVVGDVDGGCMGGGRGGRKDHADLARLALRQSIAGATILHDREIHSICRSNLGDGDLIGAGVDDCEELLRAALAHGLRAEGKRRRVEADRRGRVDSHAGEIDLASAARAAIGLGQGRRASAGGRGHEGQVDVANAISRQGAAGAGVRFRVVAWVGASERDRVDIQRRGSPVD